KPAVPFGTLAIDLESLPRSPLPFAAGSGSRDAATPSSTDATPWAAAGGAIAPPPLSRALMGTLAVDVEEVPARPVPLSPMPEPTAPLAEANVVKSRDEVWPDTLGEPLPAPPPKRAALPREPVKKNVYGKFGK